MVASPPTFRTEVPAPPETLTLASVTWTVSRLGLEIAKGVKAYCATRGWRYMRLDNRAPLSISALRKHGVGAFVIQCFEDAPIDKILSMGLPTVNVSNSRVDCPAPRVVTDDVKVGEMAAEYFSGKGFKRFAVVSNDKSGTAHLREKGFVDKLRVLGHRAEVIRGPYDLPVAYLDQKNIDGLGKWMAKLEKPCALFAWNDSVCDTVANLSYEMGFKVPDEFSLLGVNNDFNRLIEDDADSVSSIQLDGHAIGFRAAQTVDELIVGTPIPPATLCLPPLRIVERHSTDFYAVMDPAVLAALRYIKQNCHHSTSVDEIAKAAMVSRRVLEKRFHTALQCSPYEVVMRSRLERAKELLLTTHLKLEEIAHLCGYDDGSNFSIFFNDRAGCSPSAFRTRGYGAKRLARAGS